MTSPENLGHQFDAVIGDQFPEHLPDGVHQLVKAIHAGHKIDGYMSGEGLAPIHGKPVWQPFTHEERTHPAVVQALGKAGRLHEVLDSLRAVPSRYGMGFSRYNDPDVYDALHENYMVTSGKHVAKEAQSMLQQINKHDADVENEQWNRENPSWGEALSKIPECGTCDGEGHIQTRDGWNKKCPDCSGTGIEF